MAGSESASICHADNSCSRRESLLGYHSRHPVGGACPHSPDHAPGWFATLSLILPDRASGKPRTSHPREWNTMARRFPRGLPISALLAALVFSMALLIRQGVGAAQSVRTEPSATWAPPRASVPLKPQITKIPKLPSVIMEQLTPITMASDGLKQSNAGWTVDPGGGRLEVRVRSALPLASLGASFALDHALNVSVWSRAGGAWLPMSLAEPLERDGPHTHMVVPASLPSGTRTVWLRFQFSRARTSAVLSRLRVYGLQAAPTQRISQPTTLQVSRTKLGPAASSHAVGRASALAPAARVSGSASSGSVAISRAAWGSPDGEDSPRWIPFF